MCRSRRPARRAPRRAGAGRRAAGRSRCPARSRSEPRPNRSTAISAERDVHQRTAESAREEAQRVQGEQDALLEAARISNARHTRLLEQAQARAEAAQAEAAAARDAGGRGAGALRCRPGASRRRAGGACRGTGRSRAPPCRGRQRNRSAAPRTRARPRQHAGRPRSRLAWSRNSRSRMAASSGCRARRDRRTGRGTGTGSLRRIRGRCDLEIEPAVEPVLQSSRYSRRRSKHSASRRSNSSLSRPSSVSASRRSNSSLSPRFEPSQLSRRLQLSPSRRPTRRLFTSSNTRARPNLRWPIATIAEPEPVRDAVERGPGPRHLSARSTAPPICRRCSTRSSTASATLFPRAALFVVKTKSKRLQGWRSVGFTGVAAITREFEFPLTTDSALTRAVTASRTIFTGDGQSAAQSAEAWTVTFPVTTGGRVVAVVHADGGARARRPGGGVRPRDGARPRPHARAHGRRTDRRAHDVGTRGVRQRHERGAGRRGAARRGAGCRPTPINGSQRARERDVRQRFTRRAAGRRGPDTPRPPPVRTPPVLSPRSSFPKSIATARRRRPPRPATSASRNGSRGRSKARARRPPRRRRPRRPRRSDCSTKRSARCWETAPWTRRPSAIQTDLTCVKRSERIETCHPNLPPRCVSWKR